MTKEKISAFQFFTMLFISRTLTTVTYLSSYTKDVRLSDMLVQPIFRISIGILIMLPFYFIYKKQSNIDILSEIKARSKLFSKVTTFSYVITFFYFTVVTIARLDVFAGTVVFPETDVDFMIVFAILLCAYGAYLGLEALGRSAVLSAILVIPALIFIMATLIKKIDLLNLTPLFYNGVTPVIKTAVDSVGQTVEYAIIVLCLPKVTGNIKKGFWVWLILQTALMATMFFFATAVMGNFTSTQLFPFHTLASLAEFSMFDRLDAIFTSVWILCAFIKAGLLIYLQADILYKEFSKVKKQYLIVIIALITIATNLFISGEFSRFSFVDNSMIKIIVTILTAFVIPLAVLVSIRKGRSKECAKQQ